MKYIKLFEELHKPKFEIGEIVVCVDDKESFGRLKKGKKYQIEKIKLSDISLGSVKYTLKNINNTNGWWEERFLHEWEWEAKKYNL